MAGSGQKRWHEESNDEAARSVADLVEHLWNDSVYRRDRAMLSIGAFEGRRILSLGPNAFRFSEDWTGETYERLHVNVARQISQGIVAKVAGRTRPKCRIVASGADWQTKRRGKRLERFVETQMLGGQGRYRNAWAVGIRAFQDACTMLGRGSIKIYADPNEDQVVLEPVYPWNVLTDPVETRNRAAPLNRFERGIWDADRLIATFGDTPEKRDAIWRASGVDMDDGDVSTSGARGAESRVVYEAWRLPLGKEPGRHVVAVQGMLLASDVWTRKEFPYVDIYWAEETLGDGAQSVCEEVMPLNDELNYSFERMQERMRLASNLVGSFEEGTLDEEFLKSNEEAIWIPRQKGSAPPTWTQPGGFNEADMAWAHQQEAWAFAQSGMSSADATGAPEPGVKSGIALRLRASQKSERFSVQANAFEDMMSVDIPRHIIACTRELAERNPELIARWPGQGFLRELRWQDVSLEEDQYYLQPSSVGGMWNTPEDRAAAVESLYNAGLIGKDAFLRGIQYLDTESEMDRTNQQNSLIERYIEDWLDANDETVANGTFRYRAPIPFMDHAAAMVQVATAYMAAELDGAPDFNLEFFRRFMEDCDRQIQKLAQQQAALQQGGAQPTAMAPQGAAPAMPTGAMVS